ncbi:PQQ-binding-like beta-propeller repeat protein [Planctomycetes bacterium K23_9]|uniref:Outer membrane protein assembly factor BamB n=1 Tax=Stieleria marina TaxID=1930275 RepID=A0A517NSI2_9BACT|nr:Outer membrane protein assembly factor BamB [Planctomycetes bacterium K23_9]
MRFTFVLVFALMFASGARSADPIETRSNWPQGSGPEGSFEVADGTAPTQWSVVRGDSIRWRKPLPETGQSTVVVWGKRLFFTTMEPVTKDSELGQNIVAWCCDTETGDTVWKREVAGHFPLRLSGCFSDSSSPPPVTDGQRICFFNASGRIACFDFDGDLIWQNTMMPVGRSQPFLVDGNVVFIKQSYMPDEHGHFTHEHKDAPLSKWTQLQALDLETGKPRWATTCGVNMGSVSLPMEFSDGRKVIVVGRGGGHSPPEKPEGISLVSADDGSTLWTLPLKGFMSTQSFHTIGRDVVLFHADEHLWVEGKTGKIKLRASIVADVPIRKHNDDDSWSDEIVSVDLGKKTRGLIQQSNVLAGRYHYFRAYTQPWLGRVDLMMGNVSYLQFPVQLRRLPGTQNDDLLWDWHGMSDETIAAQKTSQRKPPQTLPVQLWAFAPNSCQNAMGHVVMGDDRSRGNGWGHHASQVPTVVGKHLYVPTMSGTVYVIDTTAQAFDEGAIVAINDLGSVGDSFTRASLSFAGGRLYAHTINEIICIE